MSFVDSIIKAQDDIERKWHAIDTIVIKEVDSGNGRPLSVNNGLNRLRGLYSD